MNDRPQPRSLLVRGGRRLEGAIALAGAKNSALKLMAASLLAAEPSTIRRVPRIADVFTMVDMLRALGAEVQLRRRRAAHRPVGPAQRPRALRARAAHARQHHRDGPHGRAPRAAPSSPCPGGCNIGPRRIDFHIRGLESLGAADRDRARLHRGHQRRPARRGRAARLPERGGHREPPHGGHRGARARPSSRTPRASPRSSTSPSSSCRWARTSRAPARARSRSRAATSCTARSTRSIADRIEAGTYLLAGVATGGDVTVRGLNPACLELFLNKLRAMGVQVDEGDRAHPRPRARRAAPGRRLDAASSRLRHRPAGPVHGRAVAGRRHLDRHRERLREPLRRGRRAQPSGRRHHHERPPRRGRRARASSPAASSRRPTCAAAPRSPSPASSPRA